jgi:hypothetical protein
VELRAERLPGDRVEAGVELGHFRQSSAVFVRVTSWQGEPEALAEGTRIYEEQIVPWLRDAHGWRGLLILLDRDGKALALTFWESEEAADAADAAIARFRGEVAGAVGTSQLSIESYDLALAVGLGLAGES